MRRCSLMAVGMLLVCCSVAFALNPALDVSQCAHKSWKVRDGAFKGAIYAIAQTPDGYLWLGTEFGLVRFDGVRAVAWQPSGDQALTAGPMHALLAARDGTLWIGADTGLASWRPASSRSIRSSRAIGECSFRGPWAHGLGGFGRDTHREALRYSAGRATCSEDAAVAGGAAGFWRTGKAISGREYPVDSGDGSRATLNLFDSRRGKRRSSSR